MPGDGCRCAMARSILGRQYPSVVRPRSGRILNFEAARGMLALLVCVGHLGLNTVLNKVSLDIHFALSVDIFFALSGFVLCYSNFFGKRTLAEFVYARIARLYPLYAATLLYMASLYWV